MAHSKPTILLTDDNPHYLKVLSDLLLPFYTVLAANSGEGALAHLLRTQDYVQRLARRLQTHLRFAHLLTKHYIELLARSAPLHDSGKVGIPDHILLNP